MAEVDTVQLSAEHGAIRHDIAVESARLGAQIGAEACGIRAGQGDIRRETANGFADTRYDVATRAGDIRREVAQESHNLSRQIGAGFCDTDSKVLETGSSIRREGSEHTNEIIKEGLKGDFNVRGDIKDARYDLYSAIDKSADRLQGDLTAHDSKVADRFFAVGRDTMDLRAQVTALGVQVRDNTALSALQTEKAVLQNTIEGQKNTQYLSDKIAADGDKTRALINDLKYHDLNRALVERQTELVNCEQDNRHWRHRHYEAMLEGHQNQWGAQFAQLQSMMQNFNSQLSEARQGMVNFGTMAGVGQSSTNNNVR